MTTEVINILREGLTKELNSYEGEFRKLKVRNEIAEEILFNIDENGMKTFSFSIELMKKIDFNGISFENFFAYGFDFSGFKGVTLDPQKVYGKDLSYSNLNGVTIINTFDDVILDRVKTEGMIYKTWELKAKKLCKTVKK